MESRRKKPGQISLHRRILNGFFLSVIFLALIAFSFVTTNLSLNRLIIRTMKESFEPILKLNEINEGLHDLRGVQNRFVNETDDSALAPLTRDIAAMELEITDRFETIFAAGISDNYRESFSKIQESWEEFREGFEEITRLRFAGSYDEAYKAYFDDNEPLFYRLETELGDFQRIYRNIVDDTLAATRRRSGNSLLFAGAAILAFVFVALLLSYRLRDQLKRPVDLIIEDFAEIAAGGYEHKIRETDLAELEGLREGAISVRDSIKEKIESLRKEIERRWEAEESQKRAQKELSNAMDVLETRVKERTAELISMNESLKSEITRREMAEQALSHRAYHDVLTDLPNRVLFRDRVEHALLQASREGRRVGLLVVDLDNFKEVNDTLGHTAGDELLKAVSQRFRTTLREGDTLSRYGGDEFLLLVENDPDEKTLELIAERILSSLKEPISVADNVFLVGASLGIAIFPRDGGDHDALFKCGDLAMYHSKRQGRGRYSHYSSDLDETMGREMNRKNEIHQAIEGDRFIPYYQPMMDGWSGDLVGMEALARWSLEGDSVRLPGEFIGHAERFNLIAAIDESILEKSCIQVKEWIDQTGKALNLSVNLSSRHFIRADLVDYIGDVLDRTKLPPKRLTLEITETYLVENYDQCRENVTALAQLGVGTAIDDFGTGYSSLSYLRNLDFKTLKIDKQFIRGAGLSNDGSPDSVLVRTILAMARNLGLKTVAEGVETEDHLKFLKEYGCDLVQGFYYTEPLSPLDFASRFLSST